MEYVIENEKLTVTVSRTGGELLSVKAADGTEFMWQGDPTYWKKRAPHLFPVVGRLTQGRCTLAGERCAMDTHGFFRWTEMERKGQGKDWLELTMAPNQETAPQYPRDWYVTLKYTLKGETLEISFTVENRDNRDMYFGYGGHPGFRVPLDEGLRFEDYRLDFGDARELQCVGFSDACYVQGPDSVLKLETGALPLRHSLFDRDAIVFRCPPHSCRLYSEKGRHSVRVTAPELSYMGLWHTPKTDAPFVCLEPWSSLPARQDVVEELSAREDYIHLPAGESRVFRWQIEYLTL